MAGVRLDVVHLEISFYLGGELIELADHARRNHGWLGARATTPKAETSASTPSRDINSCNCFSRFA